VSNHPNRSKRASEGANPAPEAIRALREAHGLTQAAAAALIWYNIRAYQKLEAGEQRMHPAVWYAFQHRAAALGMVQ